MDALHRDRRNTAFHALEQLVISELILSSSLGCVTSARCTKGSSSQYMLNRLGPPNCWTISERLALTSKQSFCHHQDHNVRNVVSEAGQRY